MTTAHGERAAGTERTLTFAQALNEALRLILAEDDRAFLIGEDVGRHGGTFQVTRGLLEEFGPERVRDAPISEAGIVGLAVGAAMTGMRPIVDMMFADFMLVAMDQIVNQAAKMSYMSGGQFSVPLVLRAAQGTGSSSGAQHSQVLHGLFAQVPGLKVVAPTTPFDAKGLLVAAFRDPNPVVVLEHKMGYARKGPVPDGLYEIPLGVAEVVRGGSAATIVAISAMVPVALVAADLLASDHGIESEVIDLRSVSPLDEETIRRSVSRTHRLVVLDEGPISFGVTAEIVARSAGPGWQGLLSVPVARIAGANAPVPFARNLEDRAVPRVSDVIEAVKAVTSR